MILAIDFDRTICDTDNPVPGYKMGPPLPFVVDALTKLKNNGHYIIIHSCRALDGPKAVQVMRDWLDYFKVPYDKIWTNEDGAKPISDFYIDDRGVHFQNWIQTLDELELRGLSV